MIAVAIVYGIGQLIESMYITPKFVGEIIYLYGHLLNFLFFPSRRLSDLSGFNLALPAGAVLLVVVRRLLAWYRQSALFV